MSVTIKLKAQFTTARAGKKVIRKGEAAPIRVALPQRIARISRLMALAIHFEGLIRRGVVRDYADLARLGGTTRARMTQIMNLLNLAPEIQERLLFLPGASTGRDAITERNLRDLVAKTLWANQRWAVPSSRDCQTRST